MLTPPQVVQDVLEQFKPAFTKPTALKMTWFVLALLLTVGGRTFLRVLMALEGLLQVSVSSCYRLFSRAVWSPWKLARFLTQLALDLHDQEVVTLVVDDTVNAHPGRKVFGKDKHRDAVRSSHSFTAWSWGHKWVVLAIILPIPYLSRPWALPLMMALYRSPGLNEKEGRRHKTPAQLAQQMMRVLMRWFPDQKFVLVGDGQYSSHEMARFAKGHRRQLVFVGRFYADAALYDPPPAYSGHGRPRVKGERRPSPQEVVEGQAGWQTTVDWYGAGKRKVRLRHGQGHWHKSGFGLVPLRWVYVEDLDGTHRPDYFFSTDCQMPLQQIVGRYTLRWNIEVTFQEARSWLGWGSTRHRCPKAVLRVEPFMLGVYSLVALIYVNYLGDHPPQVHGYAGYSKSEATFGDALITLRRLIWEETIFTHPDLKAGIEKVPPKIREFLLNRLTQAA